MTSQVQQRPACEPPVWQGPMNTGLGPAQPFQKSPSTLQRAASMNLLTNWGLRERVARSSCRDASTRRQAPHTRYAPRIEARQRLVGIARDTNMATGHQHHSSNRALRISYQLSYGTR